MRRPGARLPHTYARVANETSSGPRTSSRPGAAIQWAAPTPWTATTSPPTTSTHVCSSMATPEGTRPAATAWARRVSVPHWGRVDVNRERNQAQAAADGQLLQVLVSVLRADRPPVQLPAAADDGDVGRDSRASREPANGTSIARSCSQHAAA